MMLQPAPDNQKDGLYTTYGAPLQAAQAAVERLNRFGTGRRGPRGLDIDALRITSLPVLDWSGGSLLSGEATIFRWRKNQRELN